MGDEIKISERVEGSSGSRLMCRGWRAGEPKRFSIRTSFHELREGARKNWPDLLKLADSALFYIYNSTVLIIS
jgi:hypothetical protein